MSAPPARGYLGIGEVLGQLRAEFPDISVSKIRFLETEGLIEPARAPSGYRKFAAADVERLRFILTAQRDHYLPLRVIKERLTRGEGSRPLREAPREAREAAWEARDAAREAREPARPALDEPGSFGRGPGQLLNRRELLEAAGITDPQLTELEAFGLLRKEGRLFTADALQVARTAAALTAYGVEARHLRTVRAAVERETTLIEHVVAPILKQRGAGARELAGQTAAELAALTMRLHRALIEGALAEAGLAGPAAGGSAAARADGVPQAPSGAGRDAAGASA